MKHANTAAALVAAAGLAGSAAARVVVEDFMDTSGANAQYDPFFSYDFGTPTDFTNNDGHGLFPGVMTLFPDRVTVDLNLSTDETVSEASVTFRDIAGVGQTRVTFVGDLGTFTVLNSAVGHDETISYRRLLMPSIGSVGSVVISGRQTLVREIRVETAPPVPAPASGALVVAGLGLVLPRRRRA